MATQKKSESFSPNDHPRALQEERRRIRLLYSLGDFQLALSACDFLYECDPQGQYSKIELRRFRCFETTLVIAYGRPFSQSEGGVPPLTLKMAKAQLTEPQQALHRRLIRMRNKIIAHSDREMMRMTAKTFDVPLDDDEENGPKFVLIHSVFDEGITLLGDLLIDTNELLRKLYHSIYKTLSDQAQIDPSLFNMRLDHDHHKKD
ncbi:hypothetical protein AS156_30040 [Bradyrhizobium macuxiense]|uniref:HEPN AbiU2-like domain-containing protein n=1 Tax=Bradyrhizobium macuxiense TaxID=1755647 RepID=A0A109K3R7_9BRAD|nr:hypothetical protein [Bradyrhizobium macuxiense]KWV60183.1 hypothetical protein AS156_30040 [Bradyrhizobium macuxiense]